MQYLTVVNTLEAVDQDKHGIRGIGLGQFVTANEAICKIVKHRIFVRKALLAKTLSITKLFSKDCSERKQHITEPKSKAHAI